MAMYLNLQRKRILSVTFIILGAVLIFFAPENAWIGAILLILGFGFEIVGLILRHRGKKTKNSTL